MKKFNINKYLNENKISIGIKDGMNKSRITEGKGNPDKLGEIFARFLIGDREDALKQLRSEIKNEFGIMETPGTKEWTNQFSDLTTRFTKAIKGAM